MSVRTILKSFFWPHTMGSVVLSPSRSAYPYASQVGDGLASSTAMAVVQFMMRAFPEAVLVVYAEQGSERTIQQRHPLARLVQQPNPAYSGMQLWMATVCDWCWFGEAYWRIVYESGGRPGQLWWVPPWSMIPQWPADGSQFISHYTYTPWQGEVQDLGLDEVIHFRHSLDPRNPRHGLPPLRSVLREIWSDDEASIWVASLLRNMAVPGLLITPKGDLGVTSDELEAVKAYIAQAFTGDHRGEPLALQAPTDVQKLSFSPHEFDLAVIRDTTEERVSAALGIPSAVIGFGSGLQSTKVGATMEQLVHLAWTNGLFPVQRAMAADIDRVLLPQFEPNPRGLIVGWDYRHVRGLQEEESAKAIRLGGLVQAGVMQRAEARREMGLPIEPGDRVYYLGMNIQQINPDWPVPPKPPAVPVAQPANGNGASTNGNGTPANGNGNGNGARVQARAYGLADLKQDHDTFVTDIIARHAPRLETPPPRLTQAVTSLMQAAQSLEAETAQKIADALSRFGATFSTTARAYFNQKQDLQAMVDAGMLLEDESPKALREDLIRLYEALATAMALLVIKSLQDDLRIEPFNIPRILANVRAQMAQRVNVLNLPIELRAHLERILEEGRADGMLPGELAKRLEVELPAGRWRSIESRAQVIAQTELRFAANITTLTVARVQGVSRVLCADARLGPSDATCLVAGTRVVAPQTFASSTRYYEGELISITTAHGEQLSMTPNHPVLTPDGWVQARFLHQGSNVVCCIDIDRAMRLAIPGCPNHDYQPLLIEQMAELPKVSGPHRTSYKPSRPTDFHGDGIGSQIYIERTTGDLWAHHQPYTHQQFIESLFIRAVKGTPAFFTQRKMHQFFWRSMTPSTGHMGGSGSRLTLLRSLLRCRQGASTAPIPNRDAMFSENAKNRKDGARVLSRNGSATRTRCIQRHDMFVRQLISPTPQRQSFSHQQISDPWFSRMEVRSNALNRLSSQTQSVQIIKIDRTWFQGHVYNLQTREGWYSANGIITHNCELRNGLVVTTGEAEILLASEHPRGTIGFYPLHQSLIEQLAVVGSPHE